MQILITITLQLLRVLELAVLGLTAYFVVPYEEFTLAARKFEEMEVVSYPNVTREPGETTFRSRNCSSHHKLMQRNDIS